MIRVPVPDYIAFLVSRKFPELRTPQSPMARTYGFNDGGIDDDDEIPAPSAETLKMAETYKAELTQLPKSEIRARYDKELEKQRAEDDERRFFNARKAEANFEHWSRMPFWSLDEAIALSFGKDPEIVFLSRMRSILSYTSPFVMKYTQLHTVTERALAVGHLTNPVKPSTFIKWAQSNSISFPEPLTALIATRDDGLIDWKDLYETLSEKSRQTISEQEEKIEALTGDLNKAQGERPLKTRERDTAHKIIIGMAIIGYAYSPQAKKNTAVSEIASDIEQLGLSVDQDTIRRWLKEATELLPPEPDKT